MNDLKNRKEIPGLSEWTEQLCALDDKKFFSIMHLYLGEIKTPYNKQNLASKLISFFKNSENLNTIKSYLTNEDLQILSAIKLISCPTQNIISSFFKDKIPLPQLYSKLQNLNERLIIFYVENKYSKEKYLKINPVIKNEIDDLLSPKLLFSECTVQNEVYEDSFTISPLILAAFISYLSMNGISCKADGVIKKNDLTHLCEIFGQNHETQIQLLMNAFINLSLVQEDDKKFRPNFNRIKGFAELDENIQKAFICAGSVSRFSREGLRKEVQLLCDCLNALHDKIFDESTLMQLSFIVQSFQNEKASSLKIPVSSGKKSRFEMMMQNSFAEEKSEPEKTQSNESSANNAILMDTMFSSAVSLGLIKKVGYDENENPLYKSALFNQISEYSEEMKYVNIDSIFSVTIMPGLPLNKLLDYSKFLTIKKIDVAAEFEITKQSVSKVFDESKTPDDIFNSLEKFSYHKVPENLKFNILEWYSMYNSAVVYKGFVLKVSEQNVRIVENDERFKKYVKEKLAEGLYLLNIPNDEEFAYFQKSCGLDFCGKVRTAQENSSEGIFPIIQNRNNFSLQTSSEKISDSENEKYELQKKLIQKVETLDLPDEAKDNLKNSIKTKLIINESQLTPFAVRTEILEASGMDYLGKLRIIEGAESNKNLVEITIPEIFINSSVSENDKKPYVTILASPVAISKQDSDAVVKIEIEPSKDVKNIFVSKITYIKWLKD